VVEWEAKKPSKRTNELGLAVEAFVAASQASFLV
jgi:hypothetical protein